MCWGEAFLRRPGRRLVVALATPTSGALEWLRLLLDLTEDVGLPVADTGCTTFTTSTVVEVMAESVLRLQLPTCLESTAPEARLGV